MRRLPVYLLIDTSESMIGTAIESVHSGIKVMLSALKQNPYSLEISYLSIITFDNKAKQICALTDVFSFRLPDLDISPGTSLGAGLKLLSECMTKEIVKTTSDQKGDYKPIVFILTDGQPTDKWETQALSFKSMQKGAMVFAIGCGDDVDFTVLKTITDNTYSMEQTSIETFAKLFVCISSSIQTVGSSYCADVKKDVNLSLNDIAPEILKKVEITNYKLHGKQRQVFINSRCQNNKKPYLMRYKLNDDGMYWFANSHPMGKEFSKEEKGSLLQVSSDQLCGISKCPYCGNDWWGQCACGALLCIPSGKEENTCPTCSKTLKYIVSKFSLDQSSG